MDRGCPDCNAEGDTKMCPKCELDYLKWCADTAQREYEEAKAKYERKQNEQVSSI